MKRRIWWVLVIVVSGVVCACAAQDHKEREEILVERGLRVMSSSVIQETGRVKIAEIFTDECANPESVKYFQMAAYRDRRAGKRYCAIEFYCGNHEGLVYFEIVGSGARMKIVEMDAVLLREEQGPTDEKTYLQKYQKLIDRVNYYGKVNRR